MSLLKRLPRGRTLGVAGAVGALVAGGLILAPMMNASAAAGCRVTYTTNQWPGGFTGNVGITNLGDPLTSWTLGWTFGDAGQKVVQGWSATFAQTYYKDSADIKPAAGDESACALSASQL